MRISDWSSDVCSSDLTIRGHTVYPYSGSGTSTWTILEIADADPANAGRILDAYRHRRYAKGSDRAGTGSGLTSNRQHTRPTSLASGRPSGDNALPNAPHPHPTLPLPRTPPNTSTTRHH